MRLRAGTAGAGWPWPWCTRSVGRQMRLPGLDMVFRLAAPAVDILVKYTGVADLQVGDDEACVGPFRAGLHTGDDPLDAAPALRSACIGRQNRRRKSDALSAFT